MPLGSVIINPKYCIINYSLSLMAETVQGRSNSFKNELVQGLRF